MAGKLDLNPIKEPLFVGRITNKLLKFLELDAKETNVVIWKDRMKYLEKHKKDFETDEAWLRHVEEIPNIIENPDYVGLHPSDGSVQFIKQIDKYMMVGVRIKTKGNWAIRSSYPISEDNLQRYIECGRVKRVDCT